MNRSLREVDPEMADVLAGELERQQSTLVMIPSENYASKAVLDAQGCIMTNKYAEGYPGARWYHGCEFVDVAESLAIARAKELFGAEHANVQPHTGTAANMAAYYALLEPGDTILAMSVDQGGHLTHGNKLNFSGRYYRIAFYGVDRQSERLDYDAILHAARHERPKLIVVGASAYPRQIDFKRCRAIADEVDAYLMADIAHIVGLIAAGLHPDPVPYCDIVTSTTHKTLRGPRGAFIMCRRELAEAIDRAVFPGVQAGPLMHVIAAKAVAFREAMTESFREYQRQIIANCQALAEELMAQGFRLTTGGTDNHLILVDLRPQTITGKEGADLLEQAGIIVNKNVIPYDHQPPAIASGIRPGTPALTTRGMKEPQMRRIAEMMGRVLHHRHDAAVRRAVRDEVRELCAGFPVYTELNSA
ncbi:MAG TPA: serine hydroxymethyltransferase [Armatimonadota bacterium]|nr:serine hydroxymethyltransferase [Armatimonadota bacterium]